MLVNATPGAIHLLAGPVHGCGSTKPMRTELPGHLPPEAAAACLNLSVAAGLQRSRPNAGGQEELGRGLFGSIGTGQELIGLEVQAVEGLGDCLQVWADQPSIPGLPMRRRPSRHPPWPGGVLWGCNGPPGPGCRGRFSVRRWFQIHGVSQARTVQTRMCPSGSRRLPRRCSGRAGEGVAGAGMLGR